MKYLQKLGKALMLPVSCMPVCALLMGLGYLLCPAAMQNKEIVGTTAEIGYFLIRPRHQYSRCVSAAAADPYLA